MPGIDYSQKIPNNVDLSSDKRLQRALEEWQPNYLEWWKSVGPTDFNSTEIYLRTAISVDSDGWAHFGYVKMPDYRWGIFLEPRDEQRTVGFGDHLGEPAWQQVPGEYRNWLRRLIVTQADTEPASVEQQRLLGHTAPSLYDMRNLFQVNVEEGRHLWAMVYLLQSYFGRDGREEAEELLQRRSGNPDHPRILGTFNEPCTDWLSFFCFTMFTDRDGKFQLLALAESGFDPLARTCRFMLTEEAHHMFVGQTGVGRVIERTCQVMKQHPGQDPAAFGAFPLELIQRYINFWYSSSTDLYGSEVSSNSANFFAAGLKGRAYEERYDEHKALDGALRIERFVEGKLVAEEVALRNAMNEVRGAVERQGQRVAPEREGPRLRAVADEALPRARQDRELDRAAAEGRRQPSDRLRVREARRLITASGTAARPARTRRVPRRRGSRSARAARRALAPRGSPRATRR